MTMKIAATTLGPLTGGRILQLPVYWDETVFPLPREFKEVDVTLIGATGEYPYRLRIDATEFDRRLDRLPRMLAPGDLAEWRFHGVPLFRTSAGRVTRAICEAGLRGKTLYAGPTLI